MNRHVANLMLAAGLLSLSDAALAEGWTWLPVMEPGYKSNLTVSAVGGQMKPANVASGGYVGAEVAFNCLLLQPPSGVIRSKISYGEFDHAGTKISTFEVNPRWTTNLTDDLTFGIGPGIGYVTAKVGGQSVGMMAGQVGADLDYRLGALNLGLGVRWQGTENKLVAAGRKGADNTLVQAKLGFSF